MYEVVHRRSSRIKGSLCKVSKSFLCRPCLVPLSHSKLRTCVDTGDGFSAKLVVEFCYMGDTLCVNLDTDAAVTATIHTVVAALKAVLNVFFSLHHLNCLYLMNTKWYLL